MGKQNGGEVPIETTESGAVPEGDGNTKEPAEDTAQRDSVPPLPAEHASAAGVEPPHWPPGIEMPNFDLLASLGEAEQFALSVKKFADKIPDPRWQAISQALNYAVMIHDRLNQARANS